MKKLKYISYLITLAVAGHVVASRVVSVPDSNSDVKTRVTVDAVAPLPPLQIETDTIPVTNEFFYNPNKKVAGGVFFCTENKVKMTYLKPMPGADRYAVAWCDLNNARYHRVLRHETEHARKVLFVEQGRRSRDAMTRARTVALNEILARVGEMMEIVERDVYYNEHGDRASKLTAACDTLIRMHNGQGKVFVSGALGTPAADVLLRGAVDDFVNTTRRGFYGTTVSRAYECARYANIKRSDQTEEIPFAGFSPELGWWGPMFTFKTFDGGKFSVWDSASPATKQYVMAQVDAVIKQHCQKPVQVPYAIKNQKSR